MNEGCGELIAVLNSNTQKTLDKLLDEVKEFLGTYVFIPSSNLAYSFNNQLYRDSTDIVNNQCPFKLKFYKGGSAYISMTLCCNGSSDIRSVTVDIYVNGVRKGYLHTDSQSETLQTEISFNEGDTMTFIISGATSGASAWIAADSLAIYADLVKLATRNLVEVIE